MELFSKWSCIVGNKNTGKTTYCKEAIKKYMSVGEGRKVVIVDTYFPSSYDSYYKGSLKELLLLNSGVMRVVIPAFEIDYFFDFLIKNDINNIFVIIEDAGKYFMNTVSKTTAIYLRDVKNKNRETLCVYHFLTDIPNRQFLLTDRLILKKTGDTPKGVREMTNREDIFQAYMEVQAASNPYYHKVINITP